MSERLKIDDRIEVQIEKLAVGGHGLARYHNWVVFVSDSAPQDLLKVRITKSQKNYCEAEIESIIQPSPNRKTPPCPYVPDCGGCNWQHISDAEQLRQKQLMVKETLQKFLPGVSLPMADIIPSAHSLRYRNRIQPKRRGKQIGYYKRKSHDFLPIEDCLLFEQPLNDVFGKICMEGKELSSTKDESLEIFLDKNLKIGWKSLAQEGDAAFSQVNRFQNDQMIQFVLDCIQGHNFDCVYDLYAGSGNFSFPLHKKFPKSKMWAVEMSSTLVEQAKQNLKQQKNSSAQFIQSDTELFLKRHLIKDQSLVLLDPPRAGASPYVVKSLAASAAKQIVYVSCHPVSLARDLQLLLSYGKQIEKPWSLEQVQCFEMFPQTDHVETIVSLTCSC